MPALVPVDIQVLVVMVREVFFEKISVNWWIKPSIPRKGAGSLMNWINCPSISERQLPSVWPWVCPACHYYWPCWPACPAWPGRGRRFSPPAGPATSSSPRWGPARSASRSQSAGRSAQLSTSSSATTHHPPASSGASSDRSPLSSLCIWSDVESRDCLYVQQCRTVSRTQQCSQLSQRQCRTVYDIK